MVRGPVHELEDVIDKKQSKVRLFSLAGALFGFALGWILTLYTSFEWNLITGGKPIASIPSFVIIAFEFTVLFGAFFTFIGCAILKHFLPGLDVAILAIAAGPPLVYIFAETKRKSDA